MRSRINDPLKKNYETKLFKVKFRRDWSFIYFAQAFVNGLIEFSGIAILYS